MRNIPVPALLERELGQDGERGCTLRSGRAQGMRSSCIPNEPALIKCSSEGTGDKHCQELAAAPSVPLPRAAAPLMALPEHHRAPCAGQRSTDASSAVPGREARGSCSPGSSTAPNRSRRLTGIHPKLGRHGSGMRGAEGVSLSFPSSARRNLGGTKPLVCAQSSGVSVSLR